MIVTPLDGSGRDPSGALDPIDCFRGDYFFLSNFSPHPVVHAGVRYPTVEHAYQAAKTDDLAARDRIAAARSPTEAKDIGRTVPLRDEWDRQRLDVMLSLLRHKFTDPALADQLLATGDRPLVEGNDWGDTFWCTCSCDGTNHLGRLLEQVRAEVAAGRPMRSSW